jgi:hypothetical protein
MIEVIIMLLCAPHSQNIPLCHLVNFYKLFIQLFLLLFFILPSVDR